MAKTSLTRPARARPDRPRVIILALRSATLSGISAPLDVLGGLGTVTNRCKGLPPEPELDVQVATIDGEPVLCGNGVRLAPHLGMRDAGRPDLIVISPVSYYPGQEEELPRAVEWLASQHAKGAHLASICTGAFPLAATGLLDGKTATTHWAVTSTFRERYPEVDLQPWRIFTDEGTLYCSAGSTAGFNLCLYLVAKLRGREAALDCARAMTVDPVRTSQSPFEVPELPRGHQDEAILAAQQRIEGHYADKLTITSLAREAGLSPRTFERRFKAATGQTPVRYLQRIRVEAAKRMLEAGHEPFDQITYQVGYEDPSTFRMLFRRIAGLSPRAYRVRFGVPVGAWA